MHGHAFSLLFISLLKVYVFIPLRPAGFIQDCKHLAAGFIGILLHTDASSIKGRAQFSADSIIHTYHILYLCNFPLEIFEGRKQEHQRRDRASWRDVRIVSDADPRAGTRTD